MVTAGGRFIVLVVLMTTEILSTPPPSVGAQRGDRAPVLAGLIDNLASRLTRLEDNISGLRNEIKEKRCETGVLVFPIHGPERPPPIHVNFTRPFTTVPWVSLGFGHLSMENVTNFRVEVMVSAKSTDGFDALALRGGSSKMYFVSASWIACSI